MNQNEIEKNFWTCVTSRNYLKMPVFQQQTQTKILFQVGSSKTMLMI